MSDAEAALGAFYRDLLFALDQWIQRPTATAQGCATVVKHVAQAHGIAEAERLALPRLSRAELEDRAWVQRR